eukprot:TRINITY_DN19318_c0_g3_i1.p1 TRINITY_DN19318_c0_g3~~TRINITY_DN19318_c0_g3_i1.p1  ORF type:complete len:870 (+),score=206.96 TRINITY_DN19318_c0_g3_i1:55-2610(+)
MSSLHGAPIPGQRIDAGPAGLASLPTGEQLGRKNQGGFQMEDPGLLSGLELLEEEYLLESPEPVKTKKKRNKKEKKQKKVKKEKKSGTESATLTSTTAKEATATDSYEEDYQDDFIAPPAEKDIASSGYSENFEIEKSDSLISDQDKEKERLSAREKEEEALLEKKRKEWESRYNNTTPTRAEGKPPVSPRYTSPAQAVSAKPEYYHPPSPQTTPLRDLEKPKQHHHPRGEDSSIPLQLPQQQPQQHHDQHDERYRWNKEQARRQRRQLERRKQHLLAEEEVAASAVMKRLANDIKGVFQELNMSIVAAERDRHQKEERYRKEREARDIAYEEERQTRDERDRRDRESREERFWDNLREQEKIRNAADTERRHREKVELEARWREDHDSKQQRLEKETDHNDKINELERERRTREDEAFREREQAAYKSQLEAYQRASRQQTEELQLRMASELDHLKEIRHIEMQNMEKRHKDAVESQRLQYEQSLQLFDVHRVNSEKLTQLVDEVRDSVKAVGDLNERANEYQSDMLKEKELHLSKQLKAQGELLSQIEQQKEILEKERQRLALSYGKFDTCVTSFSARHSEEIQNLQAAQARANSLRDIVEEQRMKHAKEIHAEMLMLEQKRSELDEERFQWLKEVQEQRLETSKERMDLSRNLERIRKEEREANTTMQEAQQKLSMVTVYHGEAADKKRFIEEEYRRLETFKEETIRKLEEEQRLLEGKKHEVETLMQKVEQGSQQALDLRKAASEDRTWTERAKQECLHLKTSADEERRNLDLIRKKVVFEKQQLADVKLLKETDKENKPDPRPRRKIAPSVVHRDPSAFTSVSNFEIAEQQQMFLRSIQEPADTMF